jgi:hypothetical protein
MQRGLGIKNPVQSSGALLFGFCESPQALSANVGAFALDEQICPLQIRPLFGPGSRIELAAELFPSSAHNERFFAHITLPHSFEMLSQIKKGCQLTVLDGYIGDTFWHL